jgi:hypothetical protein
MSTRIQGGVCASPVLLIVWNRPNETRQALQAIRTVRPAQLYVAGDGPRTSDESKLTMEVRELVSEMVDWPCELTTNYSETNLGCRAGVTRAIDWFFAHVSEGIILEDDCVAHPDFFFFCDEMLHRYRHNHQVFHIAGDNTPGVEIRQEWSYCFVRYPHIWGWATWRRAWNQYDRNLDLWSSFRSSDQVDHVFDHQDEYETWVPIFDTLRTKGKPDTWDWQWAATCILHNALCVQPVVNLISNVGFNERGTHTTGPSSRSDARTAAIFPLRHPRVVYRHREAERQIFLNSQASMRARGKKNLCRQYLQKIRNYTISALRQKVSQLSSRFTRNG